MNPAPIIPVDGAPLLASSVLDLPLRRRAGSQRVDRAQAVERCARLLKACPELDLDGAWQFVAGFELGRWRKAIGLEISEVVARLDYAEDPWISRSIEPAPCR